MTAGGNRMAGSAGRALVVVVVALGGCGEDRARIETALQERWSEAVRLPLEEDEEQAAKLAPSPEAWEEGLGAPGVLSIAEARAVALRYSPDIHAARARIEQAAARVAEARSAFFPSLLFGHTSNRTFQTPATRNRIPVPAPLQQVFPTIPQNVQDVDVNTFLQLLTSPLFGGSNQGGISQSFSQHTTNLSVTWTLFDGLTREATLLASRYGRSAATLSLADVQRLLVRAVEGAYYQAQLGREQLRIAQADVEFSGRQLDAARRRLDAGKATETDVLNFEVRFSAAQADEQAAIGLYRNARTVLAELMGLDEAKLPDGLELSPLAEEGVEDLTPPDVEQWVDRALASRPDITQLEFELQSKTEEVRAAKGQYYPNLLLTGTYGFDKLSSMGYSEDDQAAAAALELRWQLFTGGLRRSRVRLAEAERHEVSAQFRRRRQKVASEVRQAATSLVNAQEQVRLQGLALVAARENRRIVDAEYDAGKASLVRLNEAQRDLIETDAGLALARIRLRQSWSDLDAAAATQVPED
jgi:outer membrane protein TolC